MITLRFSVVEFMDARPLTDADVTASLLIYPVIRPLVDSSDAEPDQGIPEARQDLGRRTGRQSARTDDDGLVTLRFDASELFDEIGATVFGPDLPVVRVLAAVVVSADVHGARFERRTMHEGVGRDADLELTVPVDLGMTIVGHTTPTSTRLWFALPFEPDGMALDCVVTAQPVLVRTLTFGGGIFPGTVDTQRVVFDGPTHTAVVDVGSLTPNTRHDYLLVLRRGPLADDIVLVTGRFRTPRRDATGLSFAFGSCHLPAVTGTPDQPDEDVVTSLNRWQSLVDDPNFEFLLLMGDQIYGDDLDLIWPEATPFQRYMRRYRQLWAHWPTREVLRSHPTYMILDDHEVADDFGTDNFAGSVVAPALECYRRFQHGHNPGGPGSPGGPFHYSFTWGPAAFFVSDIRTQRGEGTPVFGRPQLDDLQRWAVSEEVAAADVVFFVAPVPLALLPAETIRSIAESLVEQAGATAGAATGFLVGATIGGFVGGPLGIAIGGAVGATVLGAVGHEVGEEVFESIEQSVLLEADLAERWDLAENQADLVRLLDLLFGLANGLDRPGGKPRAVFVLSGDVHVGTMHAIRSLTADGGPDHRRNPLLMQLTSSAISVPPVNSGLYELAVRHASADLDIDLKDINLLSLWSNRHNWDGVGADIVDSDEIFGPDDGQYVLDTESAQPRYLTQFAGLLMERTVGRASVERLRNDAREYRFSASVRGTEQVLQSRFDLDLDADRVVPITERAGDVVLNAPARMTTGVPTTITVEARNTGVSPWNPGRHLLVVLNPEWEPQQMALSATVAPRASHTFRFRVRTGTNGTHRLQVQMARGTRRTDRFGPPSNVVTVRCEPAAGPPSCADLAAQLSEAKRRVTVARDELREIAEPTEEDQRTLRRAQADVRALQDAQRDAGCIG